MAVKTPSDIIFAHLASGRFIPLSQLDRIAALNQRHLQPRETGKAVTNQPGIAHQKAGKGEGTAAINSNIANRESEMSLAGRARPGACAGRAALIGQAPCHYHRCQRRPIRFFMTAGQLAMTPIPQHFQRLSPRQAILPHHPGDNAGWFRDALKNRPHPQINLRTRARGAFSHPA